MVSTLKRGLRDVRSECMACSSDSPKLYCRNRSRPDRRGCRKVPSGCRSVATYSLKCYSGNAVVRSEAYRKKDDDSFDTCQLISKVIAETKGSRGLSAGRIDADVAFQTARHVTAFTIDLTMHHGRRTGDDRRSSTVTKDCLWRRAKVKSPEAGGKEETALLRS